MFPIRDTRIREFCADVADVDYIVGEGITRRGIISEQQYIDLQLLFTQNDYSRKSSPDPYVKIMIDDSGKRYAFLSESGVQYALNNDLSFMPECRCRDSKNVPLHKAGKLLEDNSLEERLNQNSKFSFRDYHNSEGFRKLKNVLYGDGKVREYVFLKFLDLPGNHMNMN
jgi:hypothetical protein